MQTKCDRKFIREFPDVPPEEVRQLRERKCVVCGRDFIAHNPDHIDTCRKRCTKARIS